jgi:hypothetical protein
MFLHCNLLADQLVLYGFFKFQRITVIYREVPAKENDFVSLIDCSLFGKLIQNLNLMSAVVFFLRSRLLKKISTMWNIAWNGLQFIVSTLKLYLIKVNVNYNWSMSNLLTTLDELLYDLLPC